MEVQGQRLLERSGKATFFSEAPLEDITAVNENVLAIVDPENGEVAVSMLMKGFQFKKSLMQEHFNESYIESDKFPKATFTGKIRDYSPEMFKKGGKVLATGEISIHGVSRPLQTLVTIKPGAGFIGVHALFDLRVEDFNIEIPSLVVDNIAEVVEVTIELELKPENDL